MARVLISPIGTGRRIAAREYDNAIYKIDNSIYSTPFLAVALAEHIKVDKIIFIGTAKSMWEEIYKYFTENAGESLDDDYWVDIGELAYESSFSKSYLDSEKLSKVMISVDKYLRKINNNASGGSIPLVIDYGLNEMELWKNFSSFMELTEILKDGDEIYLDITHSFRSIPLFMYLIMDFLQTLNYKKVTLSGLYYGMLEANREMGFTPVVDLSQLFKISQWIRGAHEFINFGNGYIMSELINKDSSVPRNVIEVSKKINNISELVNINYLTDLQNQIQSLNSLMTYEYDDNGAFTYIVPLIREFTSRFSGIKTSSEFQIELSKWYFENKRYGHGYICLVEAILTKLCEVYNLDLKNFKNREGIKELVAVRYHQRKLPELARLAEKFNQVNNIRNRIAHAAFYQGEGYSFRNDIDQANKNYEDIKRLLESKGINDLSNVIPIEDIRNFNEKNNK